jgi:hypothetical protein
MGKGQTIETKFVTGYNYKCIKIIMNYFQLHIINVLQIIIDSANKLVENNLKISHLRRVYNPWLINRTPQRICKYAYD